MAMVSEMAGRTRQDALADRTWHELAGEIESVADVRLQDGRGNARNRAKARLNWFSQGQRWGRCKVRRRAERVSRPAREKKRRRRVLVVTTCSPRPMRAVQRARLWAIACTASQAPLAAKRPEGRWFSPTPYLSLGWRSRSRRGGDGRPPVPRYPPPGR